jgi:hypothetical protein
MAVLSVALPYHYDTRLDDHGRLVDCESPDYPLVRMAGDCEDKANLAVHVGWSTLHHLSALRGPHSQLNLSVNVRDALSYMRSYARVMACVDTRQGDESQQGSAHMISLLVQWTCLYDWLKSAATHEKNPALVAHWTEKQKEAEYDPDAPRLLIVDGICLTLLQASSDGQWTEQQSLENNYYLMQLFVAEPYTVADPTGSRRLDPAFPSSDGPSYYPVLIPFDHRSQNRIHDGCLLSCLQQGKSPSWRAQVGLTYDEFQDQLERTWVLTPPVDPDCLQMNYTPDQGFTLSVSDSFGTPLHQLNTFPADPKLTRRTGLNLEKVLEGFNSAGKAIDAKKTEDANTETAQTESEAMAKMLTDEKGSGNRLFFI